jgi:hypothetical protein
MRPSPRTGVIVAAVSVTVSFLTVCVPGAGAAQSVAPSGAAPAPAVLWAYGGLGSRSWSGSGNGYAYEASVTAGFAVIIGEATVTPGNLTLNVSRTMGVILSVEFCAPSCSHPVESATVHYHAWEVERAVLNLTTAGNVTVSGVPTGALAISNSTVSVVVGLRESSQVVVLGVPVRGRNISVDLDANSSTRFTPALGLVPLSIPAPENWSSLSATDEVGSASWSVVVQDLNGTIPVNVTGSIPFNLLSTVALAGGFDGATLRLGGASYDVVHLAVTGPFSLREGFLLIPTGSDLFGATAPGWLTANASTSGSASFSQGNVDVTPEPASGSHLGFDGSAIVWSSASTNPVSDSSLAQLAGPSPAGTPQASGSNATSIQGGPESVTQATTDQHCLATGYGCTTVGAPSGLPGELVVVIGVVAAGAVVAGLIAERRRIPPPTYPNAALYPPGPATPTGPGPVRRPTPPSSPPEDDPLAHLW